MNVHKVQNAILLLRTFHCNFTLLATFLRFIQGPCGDGDSESGSASETERKRGTLAQTDTATPTHWEVMEREEEERERRLEPLRLTCGDFKGMEVERKAEESSLTSTCQSLTRHHDTIITATLDSPSAPPSHCSRQTERDTDEGKSQRDDTHIHPCKMLIYNAVKNASALAFVHMLQTYY